RLVLARLAVAGRPAFAGGHFPRRTPIADCDVSAARGRGAPAVVRRSHQELPLQTAVSPSTPLLGNRCGPGRGAVYLLYGIRRRTHSSGGHRGRVDLLSRLDGHS